MEMIQLIQRIFKELDHKWLFKDGRRLPTEDEFKTTLDTTRAALVESEDQTQISVGRLIVKKDQGHYDVYVHVGEL